jgi:hypothetical protein
MASGAQWTGIRVSTGRGGPATSRTSVTVLPEISRLVAIFSFLC